MHFIAFHTKCSGTMQEVVNTQFSQIHPPYWCQRIFLDPISYRIKTKIPNLTSQVPHDLDFHPLLCSSCPCSQGQEHSRLCMFPGLCIWFSAKKAFLLFVGVSGESPPL